MSEVEHVAPPFIGAERRPTSRLLDCLVARTRRSKQLLVADCLLLPSYNHCATSSPCHSNGVADVPDGGALATFGSGIVMGRAKKHPRGTMIGGEVDVVAASGATRNNVASSQSSLSVSQVNIQPQGQSQGSTVPATTTSHGSTTPDTSSTSESSKRGRSNSHLPPFWNSGDPDKRLKVSLNDLGSIISEDHAKLSISFGVLASMGHLLPLNYEKWSDIPIRIFLFYQNPSSNITSDDMVHMVHDATDFHDMKTDRSEANEETKNFFKLLEDAKADVYAGNKKFTMLSLIVHILQLKALYGWTDKSVEIILGMLEDLLPGDAKVPKSCYEAKILINDFWFPYETWDACPNNCMLFRG
ncbi:hypothetical protein BUALT_Bualt13G0085200 [Buddleja alternifolia]|uniref:Uncharacterized protein n=1 Tax=Buddleja alternifolia TaxID=168488 RepID=A0AAV6WL28_9LAMI|nr:hypothetical protein BUALT_Bualt13G0085200 [Buddleja alternifolia]